MSKLVSRRQAVACGAVAALATIVSLVGCGSEGGSRERPYKLPHGELVEVVDNRELAGVVVVKAKIKSSYDNEATVKQNYYNACDYIRKHDMTGVDHLDYWAVADMSSGNESKVVSFTVPGSLFPKIQGSFADNTLGDYVTDLWIHPSLQ